MTENPYQSPKAAADAVEILVESREYLRSVARSQKGILFYLDLSNCHVRSILASE